MATTRYYLPVGVNDQSPVPVVPYSTYWTWTPQLAAATTDNLSRRTLTATRPTTTSAQGANASRPSPLPGTTAGFQLRTPPFTEPRGLGGTYRLAWPVGYIGNAAMAVRVRLVASDGTVKAVLSTATGSTLQPNGQMQVRVLSGNLSGAAAAGDFLLFELGFSIASGLGGSANLSGYPITSGQSPATDWPYEDGTTTVSGSGGQPWVEVSLDDPPHAPTGLTVTDIGSEQLTATWTAPAGGGPVSGYMVSIQDTATSVGTSYDVGLALSHTLVGLIPATGYLVTVNAYGPGGGGPTVSTVATTLAGAAYRAVVRLGSRVWDVLAGDPPSLGPILPVSFGWAVPEDALGFPAQPDPDLANLELVTADHADLAGVDIGTPMRVSLYTSTSPTARPLATFRGRVADMEAAPHPLGLSWRVLGVGYDTDLGALQVGTSAWPQESGDARAARIAAEAGVVGWSAPAIGSTFEPREPAATTARAALLDVANQAVSAEGTSFGPSRRVLIHPTTDDNGDLTAAPFHGAEVLRRVDALDVVSAGLVNRSTTWRRTKLLDATWVRIDHPGGPTTYGDTRGPAYPPQSVTVTDPRELADLILDTTPGYRWLTGQPLRLELWADDGPALAVVSQWFYRDPASPPFPWSGRAVLVRPVDKSPDGSATYAGMLTAATMRLEHDPARGGLLVVDFRLRPDIPAQSTVTMRWMDEPPTATWADELAEDPTGTWYDYYTTPRP